VSLSVGLPVQCNRLRGNTRLGNDLICVDCRVTRVDRQTTLVHSQLSIFSRLLDRSIFRLASHLYAYSSAAWYRANAPSFPAATLFGLDTHIPAGAHYTATATFSTNSQCRRCCCCKPTAHCNPSRDPVDLLEKLASDVSSAQRYSVWQVNSICG